MTTITIKQLEIRAVSYAMAGKDMRCYLNGMLVQTNGAITYLVATDGHRMHAVRIDHETALQHEKRKYVIPDTMIKTILKAKPARTQKVTLTFGDGKVAALLPDGTEAIANLGDGKFPDWQQIITTIDDSPDEPCYVKPEYLVDAVAGLNAYWGVKNAAIAPIQRGNDGVVLAVCGYFSRIMPMHTKVSMRTFDEFRDDMAMPESVMSTDNAAEE